MLVLSRKLEQEIKLGSDITIRVLAIAGNQVKLGIEAPRELKVWRAELTGITAGEITIDVGSEPVAA